MRRFFVDKIPYHPDLILIPAREAAHITKVLRMKKGDKLILFDGKGKEFESTIEKIFHKEVWVRTNKSISPTPSSSPLKISLAQSFVKAPALDYLLQKTTELGVNDIHLLHSERTVVKINLDNLGKKMIRWQEIVKSACRQCGRTVLPDLKIPMSFEESVKNAAQENTLCLILWENEEKTDLKTLLRSMPPVPHIFAIVGPEGGFTTDEINFAKKSGFKLISLGKRILRSETAAIALLSILQYEWGDLNFSFRK